MDDGKALVLIFFYLTFIMLWSATFTSSSFAEYEQNVDFIDYDMIREMDSFAYVNESEVYIEYNWKTGGAEWYLDEDGHHVDRWGNWIDTPLGFFKHVFQGLFAGGDVYLDIDEDNNIVIDNPDDFISMAVSFFGVMFAYIYFMLSLLSWNLVLPWTYVPFWLKLVHMAVTLPVYVKLISILAPYVKEVIKALPIPFS